METEIKKTAFTSLYLDLRYKKENGLFTLKLRVYANGKRKLYPTKFEFTESEYNELAESKRPSQSIKEIRLKLDALLLKAEETTNSITPFSFDTFEKKMFAESGADENIIWHYSNKIENLKQNGQIGTASLYDLSLKSLIHFIEHETQKIPNKISFNEITPHWLERYESYMTNSQNRSSTTVGIYLRNLRAIFNNSIYDKVIPPDTYPFGKRKYCIPAGKSVKKALSKEQLKILFEAVPLIPEQEKAKDFWFFSYSCNGMNIKDIVLLKYKNLENDKLIFLRAKTIKTSKEHLKPVVIYLTEYAKSIIQKYGNADKNPNNLIFSIITDNNTLTKQAAKIKNFTRYVNQHIKILAQSVGLPDSISFYWARHSFATNAIRSGASIEFVSEALNHSDIKTTKSYFAGFTDETKKDFAETLMNF